MTLLLPYQLTEALLALAGFVAFSLVWHRRARRVADAQTRDREQAIFRTLWGALLAGLLLAQAGGWIAGQKLLRIRIQQIQELVGGYAPTLAKVLTELGHEQVRSDLPGNGSIYRELLERMTRWQRDNRSIQSLYTMRKEGQGHWTLIVSPSCDLNRDGIIRGPLEQSDTLGTPYDEPVPEMDSAWAGKLSFQEEPTSDAWGNTISIFCPLLDGSGKVEAILGIDFDARLIRREMVTELLLFLSILFLLQLVLAVGAYRLWNSRIETEHARLEHSRMAEIASTDLLTGLANRRHLEMRFEREQFGLSGTPRLALIVYDIDRYKSINDTWGHEVGDHVLTDLSAHLRTRLRANDLLCRWGGDEFAILLPATGIEGALALAETLRKAASELEIPPVHRLTCSFGVAELREGETLTHVLRRADEGLYRAKEAGRDRVMAGA